MEKVRKKGLLVFLTSLLVMILLCSPIFSYDKINATTLLASTYNYLQERVSISNPNLLLVDFDNIYNTYNGTFELRENEFGVLDHLEEIPFDLVLSNTEENHYDFVRDGFILNNEIIDDNIIYSPILEIDNSHNYVIGEDFDTSFVVLNRKVEANSFVEDITYDIFSTISFCIDGKYVNDTDNYFKSISGNELNYVSKVSEIAKNVSDFVMMASVLKHNNSNNCYGVPFSCYLDRSIISAPYNESSNSCEYIAGRNEFTIEDEDNDVLSRYTEFFSDIDNYNFNTNTDNCKMNNDNRYDIDTSYEIADTFAYDGLQDCYIINVGITQEVTESAIIEENTVSNDLYYGIANVVVNSYEPVYEESMLDVEIDQEIYNVNESVLITIKAISGTNLTLKVKSDSEEKNYNSMVGTTAFLVFEPKYAEDYEITANLSFLNISKEVAMNFSVKKKLSCSISTLNEADVNDSIFFESIIEGGSPDYYYKYTFETGKTSILENPTHKFSTVGNYRVSLKVTDNDGKIVNCYQDIRIKAKEYDVNFDVLDLDGNAIGDVTITIDDNSNYQDIKTNVDGKASFKLNSGNYKISFKRSGYAKKNMSINVSQDRNINLKLEEEVLVNEVPEVKVNNPLNSSVLIGASLSVSFEAKSSIGINNCKLLISDSYRKGYLLKDEILFDNKTMVSSTLVSEVYNGSNKIKVVCENNKYSGDSKEVLFRVDGGLVDDSISRAELKKKYEEDVRKKSEEMTSLNAITGNVAKESLEELNAREKEIVPKYLEAEEKLNDVTNKLGEIDYEDRAILKKLDIFRLIPSVMKKVRQYKSERLDLNAFGLSETDEHAQAVKISSKFLDEMENVIVDFEIIDKKRTTISLSEEEIENGIESYMKAKELRKNAELDEKSLEKVVKQLGLNNNIRDAKELQDEIVLNYDIIKLKLKRFDGTIENIVVLNKVLEFSDSKKELAYSKLKIVDIISEDIAKKYSNLEIDGEYELLKEDLVIAFPVEVNLEDYRSNTFQFTYYIENDLDIETVEDGIISIVSKDLTYYSNNNNGNGIFMSIILICSLALISFFVFAFYLSNTKKVGFFELITKPSEIFTSSSKFDVNAVPPPKPKSKNNLKNKFFETKNQSNVPGVSILEERTVPINTESTNLINGKVINQSYHENNDSEVKLNAEENMNSTATMVQMTSKINKDIVGQKNKISKSFSKYVSKAKSAFKKKSESEVFYDMLNTIIDLHQQGRGEDAVDMYNDIALLYSRCCKVSKEKLSPIMDYLAIEMDASRVSKILKEAEVYIEDKEYLKVEKSLLTVDKMFLTLPDNIKNRFTRKYDNVKLAMSLNSMNNEIKDSVNKLSSRKKNYNNQYGIVRLDDFGNKKHSVNDHLFS